MHAFRFLVGLGLLAVAFPRGQADGEWPRWRGPNGTGVAEAKGLPVKWSLTDAAWRVSLPGSGHSSPVIWGERLFVTAADPQAGELNLVCLNSRDGRLLWTRAFPLPKYPLHRYNALATSTPATAGQRVFVTRIEGPSLHLTALDDQGGRLWDFDAGPFETQHGMGHSPIVVDDLVILANDQDLAGFIVALEVRTGRERWRATRSPGRADYSTPCVWASAAGQRYLIHNTGEDGVGALDLRDGQPFWTAKDVLDKRSVSSPVLVGDVILGSCGSGGGGNYLIAVRPPTGAAREPVVAWEMRRSAPYVPTSVAVGDLAFLWGDGGIVTCVEASSGKVHWQERVGGNHFSSPVSADGKVYGTSTEGQVTVLAASSEYRLLGRSTVGEATHATPAIAHDRLFFRTLTHVMAVGKTDD